MRLINPRCKSSTAQHYVSSDGFVMPCCWIANSYCLNDYYSLFSDCLNEMNIKNRKLSEIISDPRFLRIENSWDTENPYKPCLKYCNIKKEESPTASQMGQNLIVDIFNEL